MTEKNQIIKEIQAGETSLGIEFGSTRIKAVLIGKITHRSLPEAMSGKISWRTVSGPTVWKISGKDCRPAIRNWQKM